MRTYKILNHAVSPETAHVIEDYPYGFRLRCKIRYWVETRRGYGQRLCHQTTNPKHANAATVDRWNAAKCGTYSPVVVAYQIDDPDSEDHGHVSHTGLSPYDSLESIKKKVEEFGAEAFSDAYRAGVLRAIVAAHKRAEQVAGRTPPQALAGWADEVLSSPGRKEGET